MDGQIQPISTLRLSTPLQNCCIGLAIAAFGVIICYFWLDRPLALFLHGNVADKTIFVWLQRVPLAFPLLSSLILAWCGLWTLMNRPFSRFQSVALTCSISFISTSLINSQLKYAFGRSWPNTWIENNPSFIQNGAFGFNPFHGGPGFASFPPVVSIWACNGNLFGDDRSLVVVSKLASDLCCLRNRSGGRTDWRELSFFE